MEFQSTPPRGWRRRRFNSFTGYFNISIHSTARVETDPQWPCSSAHHNFNPLHREGGDSAQQGLGLSPYNFNPLHREGGDSVSPTWYFNHNDISIHSTARVETGKKMTVSEHIRISIHSTARVETDYSMGPGQVNIIFQSTPPRGWRHIHLCPWLHFHIISIHSTARVETVNSCSRSSTWY